MACDRALRLLLGLALVLPLASAGPGDPTTREVLATVGLAQPLDVCSDAREVAEGPCTTFATTWDGGVGGRDLGSRVALSPDGATAFGLGLSVRSYSPRDYRLAVVATRTDDGTVLWSRLERGPEEAIYPIDVVATASHVFVVGRPDPAVGSSTTTFVAALDAATGGVLWTSVVPDRFAEAQTTPDGSRLFLLRPHRIVALDATSGAVAVDVDLGGSRQGRSTVAAGGDVAYEATVLRGAPNVVLTRAIRLGDGAVLWEDSFDGAFSDDSMGYEAIAGVFVSPDGGTVYTAFDSQGPRTTGMWRFGAFVLARDAVLGVPLWQSSVSDGLLPSGFTESSAALAADGSLIALAGSTFAPSDFATVAVDARSGAVRWISHFDGRVGGHWDVPRAVAVADDGSRVFVAGSAEAEDADAYRSWDITTIGIDGATGFEVWVERFGTLESDFGEDVAWAAGRVVTVGRSGPATNAELTLVGYDAMRPVLPGPEPGLG